ncbi:MAG: TetR/AcrR family transcriptional regulator [Tetrasphaera sp.]|nr:TetR/AcrR family transcriptional regulator [Tetrasphaera sp.]
MDAWSSPRSAVPDPTAIPRRPLRRASILRAAIHLADSDGLDAVSMRGLAQILDVVPMALYRHVADKEDLIDGMVEEILAELPAIAPMRPTDWREAVRAHVHAARELVTRHAWARRALETRTTRTPAVLAHMERLTQVFLRAGFSTDLTHHVMHLLGNRIWGFSPELFDESATVLPGNPPAAEPTGSGNDAPGGKVTLEVILDGVSRLRRAKWRSDAGMPPPSPRGGAPREHQSARE